MRSSNDLWLRDFIRFRSLLWDLKLTTTMGKAEDKQSKVIIRDFDDVLGKNVVRL